MWKCVYLPWHKLRLLRKFETGGKEILCSCGRHYAMLDRVKAFVPWDDSFDEHYKGVKVVWEDK